MASFYLKNLEAYSVYKCLSSNSVSLLKYTHNFHFLNKVTMILGKRYSKQFKQNAYCLGFKASHFDIILVKTLSTNVKLL